jgi:hypothetical protein
MMTKEVISGTCLGASCLLELMNLKAIGKYPTNGRPVATRLDETMGGTMATPRAVVVRRGWERRRYGRSLAAM